ncbi:carboxylesterase [Amphritea opalescens]|uniref:Carboxylesterase n=1 Tax=Amphritea opalescens TaxID=2490544 RepID=A0A430KTF7_9GAMM|nr:dienelactone hydrolase family protein [Amphritea opalescens]RTE66594.1 carboxylesterase [Amphritea opalescens]
MTEQLLSCVEVEPTQTAMASVIWLHGLGADGHDFEAVVPALNLPDALPVRFVFPNAPVQPVTVNGGWEMPAWYDILEMTLERKIDVAGLLHSVSQINRLIEREIARGVAADKIVLAGFSQGGAVAYHAALCFPQRLAGLLTLSTYVATAELIKQHRSEANQALPIAIHHGTADDVVPISLGQQANELLQQLAYKPQWHSWPVDHSLCLEEIEAIGEWLTTLLTMDTL